MSTERVWRKSSRSNSQSTCVALAVGTDVTGIRDTKNPDADELNFDTKGAFGAFLAVVRAGQLDLS